MRLFALCLTAFIVGGCATNRTITITAKPADAKLVINGVDRGMGPITENFNFDSKRDVQMIVAKRYGYRDAVKQITADERVDRVTLELKPNTKTLYVNVEPAAALIFIDGKQVTPEPVTVLPPREFEFPVDAKNFWKKYTIRAERTNFLPAERVVEYSDLSPNYTLVLEPMKKDLTIKTNPPGAKVYLDDQLVGVSELQLNGVKFMVDLDTNEFYSQTLKVEKPGYDSIEQKIGWDGGKSEYLVDLTAKTKTVKLLTTPPGATISLDGKEVKSDANGEASFLLQFPPINDGGELRSYSAVVSKKTAESEWERAAVPIAWDNGKTEYKVELREILTRPSALIVADFVQRDNRWEIQPKQVETLSARDGTDGGSSQAASLVTRPGRGNTIDSLTVSPDGSQLLFTVLIGNTAADFRSQMFIVRTDGTGGADLFSDGKSLDLNPCYTPGGDQIVFASNRAGNRLSIWSMASNGAPGVTQLTSGESHDLWPCINSDPKPKLFYQAMIDNRPEPKLFSLTPGTQLKTDLSSLSGTQPRVSPRNDEVLFASANPKTGKRDIYKMSMKGGAAQNLTNSPDSDDFDASWNRDGSKIVFASDRGSVSGAIRQFDLFVLDLGKAGEPVRITNNPSHDDRPVWDPFGTFIYFRSNRGGDWGIWKAPTK